MPLRDDLATRLRDAMKRRDRPVTAALRSALGELANAEAVPTTGDVPRGVSSEHVAGAVVGVGAAEAERRTVSDIEARAIVERTRAELIDHAARLTQLCRLDEADGARRAASVLGEALDAAAPDGTAPNDKGPDGTVPNPPAAVPGAE